ncbi:M1 family metallopeptidase [Rhodococcus chondri]|uniref:Aminopeptidase N n=1 Tax=Rhodococcus chondri TaxID=3065941 RepID=A0ABU7JWK6_9NOCA|nr:M1 family metallopeptidase [Rhodococcus sp. CC-R104]MEE2033899.1 M1 family metallopeptidase [Rhodococcus sp. CC-R104]
MDESRRLVTSVKPVRTSKAVAPVGTDRPLDSYLPESGNRGYRVSRYELDLAYKVVANRLDGRATVIATTTDVRAKYSLDLAQTMRVAKVALNGKRPAKFAHRNGKLTVAPAEKIPAGAILTFTIQYSGTPSPLQTMWGEVGWEELEEGSLVASQPNGAPTWFPCDDHPGSKATYRITVTTDAPFTAVANGTLLHKTSRSSRTTWVYEQPEPMATYLATVQVGHYETRKVAVTPVPQYAVHPPRLRAQFDKDFARQPQMLELFTRLFGPYPFAHYTALVTDDDLEIPIEAQGLSTFGANFCDGKGREERLVAHELAHQWFGNSLTLHRWRDIWLHEGFACYAEWLWSENSGGPSAQELSADAYRGLAGKPQDIVLGDPGPRDMFDDRIYKRGALTLHALRLRLGDDRFFTLLRTWTTENRHSNVTTEQFTDLATRFTDTSLRALWDGWLWDAALPPSPRI